MSSALDEKLAITPAGKAMALFPIDPMHAPQARGGRIRDGGPVGGAGGGGGGGGGAGVVVVK